MVRRKQKETGYEDEPEQPNLLIGSYGGFQEVPKADKPLKPQIGFIRRKTKCSTPQKN